MGFIPFLIIVLRIAARISSAAAGIELPSLSLVDALRNTNKGHFFIASITPPPNLIPSDSDLGLEFPFLGGKTEFATC